MKSFRIIKGWLLLIAIMAICLIVMPLLTGFIIKLLILSFKFGFNLI